MRVTTFYRLFLIQENKKNCLYFKWSFKNKNVCYFEWSEVKGPEVKSVLALWSSKRDSFYCSGFHKHYGKILGHLKSVFAAYFYSPSEVFKIECYRIFWNNKVKAKTHYLKNMVYFTSYNIFGLSNIKFQLTFVFITFLTAENWVVFHIS